MRREGSFDAEALPCATKRRLPEIALKHAIASCTVILLLSFAGGAPARTAEDATGSYVWGHALPAPHIGIAWAQVAELHANGTVLTSNGLELVCK